MPPKKSKKAKLNSAALDLLGKDVEVLDQELFEPDKVHEAEREESKGKKSRKDESKKTTSKKKENNVLIWLNRATKGLSQEQMETLANVEFFSEAGGRKGEKIFPQEPSQELLEIINLLKIMDFDEVMKFLNNAIKTSKTIEGVRYKIIFSNPTLKKQNAILRQQEELQLNKQMIRKGIYKCPECQKYNTMHWSAITRGDEAGIINAMCLRCRKPFRPAQ